MKIVFNSFRGVAPKFDIKHIPDGYSEVSHNTKSDRAILEPWALPQDLGTYGRTDAMSMYKYRKQWFTWPEIRYAVKAPLKNDAYDFVVIAAPDKDPEVVYNLNAEEGSGPFPAYSYPLNVPTPDKIVSAVVADAPYWVTEDELEGGKKPLEAPEENEYDFADVAYSFCYVDAWGRLSALADPSELVTIREYEYLNTTETTIVFPAIPESLLLTDPLRGTTSKIRVYRTNMGSNGASLFQFIEEIEATATEYKDTMYSGDLLDAPINLDWVGAPNMDEALYPNGPMEKIVVMGNETLVGHNKRLLCFAEPDAFYAWPVRYYKVFQEDIVTIQTAGSNLVVLTTGVPYVVQGVHPQSMDAARLSEPVPCSSKRGSTEVAGSVYFVSETGLYRIEGYTMGNVSNGFIDSDTWRTYDPSTMILGNYDNKVFVHCPTVKTTLVFDALDANAGMRTLDLNAHSFVQLEESNDLAYVSSDDNSLKLFDASKAGYMPMEYKSKTYEFNDPICFNLIKVRASAYPVRVTVACHNPRSGTSDSYTKNIESAMFAYLPFNSRTFQWSVSVSPISEVAPIEIQDIQLAQSPEELE